RPPLQPYHSPVSLSLSASHPQIRRRPCAASDVAQWLSTTVRAILLLPPSAPSAGAHYGSRNGCVFVKDGEDRAAAAAGEAVAEARSLHAIRSALEDLDGFLHLKQDNCKDNQGKLVFVKTLGHSVHFGECSDS
ncbi:hypothetical protein EJB05_25866, partial [Eragrostis curvula]